MAATVRVSIQLKKSWEEMHVRELQKNVLSPFETVILN